MIVYGINTIKACLEARSLKKVLVSKEFSNNALLQALKENKINVEYVDKNTIDSLAKGNHQGIIGYIKDIHTVGLEEIIHDGSKKENPIVVMLDGLTDPHNLGAILRSCDAFDVSGVIYKKKGSVTLNDTVAKVSTGAINFVKCAEVTNLSQAIEKLKKSGYWVVGLDGEANAEFKDIPTNSPICLVVGSEGFGISRLVKKNCDLLVKIPMWGKVNCLNASVACSIGLYALRTL